MLGVLAATWNSVLKSAAQLFHKRRDIVGPDNSGIKDQHHEEDPGKASGADRRVILENPELQGLLARKAGELIKSQMFVELSYFSGRAKKQFLEDLQAIGGVLATWLRDDANIKGKQLGYPKRMHELQVLRGINTEPQDPHQDTRLNFMACLIELNAVVNDLNGIARQSKTTTWVADPKSTSLEFACTDELKYIQLDVKEASGLRFHGAWPHYGPGNASSDARLVLLFTFAMDEVAERHSTDEHVYPASNIRSNYDNDFDI
jgi:hypothetical protein